ncbi:helix-turn-helix transcriptional regulator [Halomicroarcula sp. F13]|uniref:Helix-turn-helix transcriptional regulator n=1 Tax=Haloarcula rubra TaxID=2487747 RepID=A0AAW4PWJ0_9EURY|nr:helix-turn-helix domain-containing protein [Halomicroarcula rubra]MBX0325532.1 helix-turn-helix transcriptional regulator [Halomicroarcula rubra]
MSSESPTATWNRIETTDRRHFSDPDSAFGAAHEVLGRKWHLRIVYYLLADGPMGFSSLKNHLDGVSSKMLSESLSSLEDQGLVSRDIVSDQPVRVEYSLTERGSGLEPVVDAIVHWDTEHGLVEGDR